MSPFHQLLQHSQKFAAGVFAERDENGQAERAWFPATANGRRNEDGFTIVVEGVFRSAAQFGATHIAVQMDRKARSFTMSIPADALPYVPKKGETRFRVGITFETSELFTVQDFRRNAGLMEIESHLGS